MINETLAGHGYGLEPAVGMLREPRHLVTMIHTPAVLAAEVLANGPPAQVCIRPHLIIARRIGVIMVGAEQKRVQGLPRASKGGEVDQI